MKKVSAKKKGGSEKLSDPPHGEKKLISNKRELFNKARELHHF